MPPTLPEPGSPLWYVSRLNRRLNDRARTLQTYEDYYSGKHKLAFASARFRDAFGGLFKEFADDWTQLVVDAVEERLDVEGFRLGQEGTEGDEASWAIWQRNNLDAWSQIAHTEALINGVSYALVWGDEDGNPEITIEHPQQMIVETFPGTKRRAAAFKRWRDDWTGRLFGTLYLPDEIRKYQSSTKRREVVGTGVTWEQRSVQGEEWPLDNPLGRVPVVPLLNSPRLLSGPKSEIAKVIPVQDAVNILVAHMLVASEYAAYRQRWATGMEIPVDPQTNQPIEPFQAAVSRLWAVPPNTERDLPEPKFGEFEATDLRNFVVAIEMFVQHIATMTRTPPHYFYLRGEFPSGESIRSAEAGLVKKAKRKQRHFGESWEEVIRLAHLVAGDEEKATVTDSQTLWADPEIRTESQHVDAILKMQALRIPDEMLWEKVGLSPQEVQRAKEIVGRMPAPEPAPVPAA